MRAGVCDVVSITMPWFVAGYGLQHEKLLTPYRGVRYHLREWESGNHRPQNAKELFNLRHSSRRMAVECAIGRLKGRWQILKRGVPGTVDTLVKTIVVVRGIGHPPTASCSRPWSSVPLDASLCGVQCACLHNFTQLCNDDMDFDELKAMLIPDAIEPGDLQAAPRLHPTATDASASAWRGGIEQRMWAEYRNYLQVRDAADVRRGRRLGDRAAQVAAVVHQEPWRNRAAIRRQAASARTAAARVGSGSFPGTAGAAARA